MCDNFAFKSFQANIRDSSNIYKRFDKEEKKRLIGIAKYGFINSLKWFVHLEWKKFYSYDAELIGRWHIRRLSITPFTLSTQ